MSIQHCLHVHDVLNTRDSTILYSLPPRTALLRRITHCYQRFPNPLNVDLWRCSIESVLASRVSERGQYICYCSTITMQFTGNVRVSRQTLNTDSLILRPSTPPVLILQVIKNQRCRRPGNEAIALTPSYLQYPVPNFQSAIHKCRAVGRDGLDVDWLALVICGDVAGCQTQPKTSGALWQLNGMLCANLSCVGERVGWRLYRGGCVLWGSGCCSGGLWLVLLGCPLPLHHPFSLSSHIPLQLGQV